MADAVESEPTSNEAILAEGLSDALASEAQVAIASDVQDVTVADSTTAPDSLQTPAAPSWMEQLGIQAADENEALERVRQSITAGQQYYQQAQYLARQQQELQAKLNAYEAAKQVAQPPQAPAQPKAEQPSLPWEPVDFDPEWLNYWDDQIKDWKPGTPYEVPTGYAKYKKSLQQFQSTMLKNPQAVIQPYIEAHAKQLIAPLQEKLEAFEARQSQQSQQQELQSFLAPYTGQLFVTDQATGQVQRDQYGNPIQTAMGQSFNQYANAVRQFGVTDDKQVALMALMAAQLAQQQQAQAAQQQALAAPTRQQQDAAIYKPKANGATRQPNRGNTINASQGVDAPLQNNRFSAEDLFRQGLREQFPNGIPIG